MYVTVDRNPVNHQGHWHASHRERCDVSVHTSDMASIATGDSNYLGIPIAQNWRPVEVIIWIVHPAFVLPSLFSVFCPNFLLFYLCFFFFVCLRFDLICISVKFT